MREEDNTWFARANCRGVAANLFFPERGESTREAKGVCAGCEVRVDCLNYAMDNGERIGVWGGLSERERRTVRRTALHARAATKERAWEADASRLRAAGVSYKKIGVKLHVSPENVRDYLNGAVA